MIARRPVQHAVKMKCQAAKWFPHLLLWFPVGYMKKSSRTPCPKEAKNHFRVASENFPITGAAAACRTHLLFSPRCVLQEWKWEKGFWKSKERKSREIRPSEKAKDRDSNFWIPNMLHCRFFGSYLQVFVSFSGTYLHFICISCIWECLSRLF